MTKTKAATFALLLAMTGAAGLASCNTVRGAGQDLEQAGSAVANEAAETEDELTDGNPSTP